jgi:hypothetical protein
MHDIYEYTLVYVNVKRVSVLAQVAQSEHLFSCGVLNVLEALGLIPSHPEIPSRACPQEIVPFLIRNPQSQDTQYLSWHFLLFLGLFYRK